jgi:hypothetical protein
MPRAESAHAAPIARTPEQESVSDDGVYWWKEFRVRRIATDEYYRLHIDAPYQEWLLEDRYLCRIPDGRIVAKFQQGRLQDAIVNPIDPDDAWTPWQLGKSKVSVIWQMLGDTSFLEAVSLCDDHRRLVERYRRLRDAQHVEYKAKEALDAAHEHIEEFKRDETRKFYKRHGEKSGPAFDKIKARTIKRLEPELIRLRAEAAKCANEWHEAGLRLAQLTRETKANEQ